MMIFLVCRMLFNKPGRPKMNRFESISWYWGHVGCTYDYDRIPYFVCFQRSAKSYLVSNFSHVFEDVKEKGFTIVGN